MKKMTPREALYYVCVELGPQPRTNRDDNITYNEARLRDAIRVLQKFVIDHDAADTPVPVLEEPRGAFVQRPVDRGDGKDRLDVWKKELR